MINLLHRLYSFLGWFLVVEFDVAVMSYVLNLHNSDRKWHSAINYSPLTLDLVVVKKVVSIIHKVRPVILHDITKVF